MGEQHQIASAALITGLSVDTIRAWERRHALVTPHRDASGHRVYGPREIARLQLAAEASRRGHSIRRLAQLTDDEIRELVEVPTLYDDNGNEVVKACLEALRRYDTDRLESLLTSAATLMPPERLVIDVLSVLMHAVGALWESGRLSVAQEHLVSGVVRDLLGNLAHLRPPASDHAMLLATPAGELHEFGILMASTLAAMRGLKIHVLGANVPAADVLDAARHFKPRTVVLGISCAQPPTVLEEFVAKVDARLSQASNLWIGGQVPLSSDRWSPRVELIPTLDDFVERIPRYARPQYMVRI